MTKKLPERKANRLAYYDYSQPNAYFVTICAKDRKPLFWQNVGASIARPQEVVLSEYGRIVDDAIQRIPAHYTAVSVDNYVIMPNHISTVVQQLKGYITKQIGFSIWQKLFHDHVIRNDADYAKIWAYIDNNPVRWKEDCFFCADGQCPPLQ